VGPYFSGTFSYTVMRNQQTGSATLAEKTETFRVLAKFNHVAKFTHSREPTGLVDPRLGN
jgi:hypothetical protein